MFRGYEIALWALLVAASITDLLWGKIFNKLTFSFLALGLVCRFALNGTADGYHAMTAVVIAFAIFFPLWLLGALAAGDVKLLMAAGAWTSPGEISQLALYSILVGALVGSFIMMKERGLRESVESLQEHLAPRAALRSHRIPFAPAFFCALCLLRIAELSHWTWL